MSSHLKKAWRDAATLIIAAKSTNKSTTGFDYRILCMKRSEKTSFLNNNICYPGGATEEQDQASGWFDHFLKHRVSRQDLESLTLNHHRQRQGNTFIFHSRDDEIEQGKLSRAVSLRISAIRETFEELGVLLCKPMLCCHQRKSSNVLRLDDIVTYQKQVHDRKITFLQLCQQLSVVPDVFSLFEWSVWLTPTFFATRRFETAFFLCTIDEQSPIYPEPNEAYSYFWRSPEEYIQMLCQDLIWYHPPQFYEFSRLSNFKKVKELTDFAWKRELLGSTLFMPIVYNCCDGMTFILPGDEIYPEKPIFVQDDPELRLGLFDGTMEEFRKRNNIWNRIEMKSPSEVELYSNSEPINGHMKPVTKFQVIENASGGNLRTKL